MSFSEQEEDELARRIKCSNGHLIPISALPLCPSTYIIVLTLIYAPFFSLILVAIIVVILGFMHGTGQARSVNDDRLWTELVSERAFFGRKNKIEMRLIGLGSSGCRGSDLFMRVV